MRFVILAFLILFAVPMGCVMWLLPAPALERVAMAVAGVAVLFGLALALPGLLRALFRRRRHDPAAELVARLEWPRSLTRAEMETFCVAWLQARGWQVSLSKDGEHQTDDVYLSASRAGVRVAILCDREGEALNPAAIRAFAHGAAPLEPSFRVLLTLAQGRLPPPAEAAAARAGVMLLKVPELDELEALVKAVTAQAA